jgi:hypothetical protein
MNMGLLLILLKINYKNSIDLSQVSFIFLGKYDDFTSDWYENIVAIIILTMIFNIATLITEFLLAMIGKCLKKCWDTRREEFLQVDRPKVTIFNTSVMISFQLENFMHIWLPPSSLLFHFQA